MVCAADIEFEVSRIVNIVRKAENDDSDDDSDDNSEPESDDSRCVPYEPTLMAFEDPEWSYEDPEEDVDEENAYITKTLVDNTVSNLILTEEGDEVRDAVSNLPLVKLRLKFKRGSVRAIVKLRVQRARNNKPRQLYV
jgi:hypothetical protein